MAKLKPILIPQTAEAHDAMREDVIEVSHFPFRVGRECRTASTTVLADTAERRGKERPHNDLYLIDFGVKLNISREHFQIEQDTAGGFELVDRNSACGTIVDGNEIGSNGHGGRCRLRSGSIIVLGGRKSEYVFRFVCPTRWERLLKKLRRLLLNH